MKIKKNLSDEEMLKGFAEKETFEIKASVTKPPKGEKAQLVSLPDDVTAKLNKEIMNIRLTLKNKGITEIKWQITVSGSEITIKPSKKGK